MKLDSSRTGIFEPIFQHRNARQETGQQALVDRLVVSFGIADMQSRFASHVSQLSINISPLLHQRVGQKIRLATFPELAVGKVLLLFLKEIPQVQKCHKIRLRISKLLVSGVGRLLFVERALPRVLNLQCGGDDQYVSQTAVGVRLEDDLSNSRIDGQFAQAATKLSQQLCSIDCANLEQRFVAVPNRLGARRVKKGKRFDISQL